MLIVRTDLDKPENIVFTGKFGEVPATYRFNLTDLPTGGQAYGAQIDDPIVIRRLLDIAGYEGHGPLPENMGGSGVDIDSAVLAAGRTAYLAVVGQEPFEGWTLRDMMEDAYRKYPDISMDFDEPAPAEEVRNASVQHIPANEGEVGRVDAGSVHPGSPPKPLDHNPIVPTEQELKADYVPQLLDAAGNPISVAASNPTPEPFRTAEVPTPAGIDNSVALSIVELRARYRSMFNKAPSPRWNAETILQKIEEYEVAQTAAVRENLDGGISQVHPSAGLTVLDGDQVVPAPNETGVQTEEDLASDGGMPKPEDMPDRLPEIIAEKQGDTPHSEDDE